MTPRFISRRGHSRAGLTVRSRFSENNDPAPAQLQHDLSVPTSLYSAVRVQQLNRPAKPGHSSETSSTEPRAGAFKAESDFVRRPVVVQHRSVPVSVVYMD